MNLREEVRRRNLHDCRWDSAMADEIADRIITQCNGNHFSAGMFAAKLLLEMCPGGLVAHGMIERMEGESIDPSIT